MSKNQFAGPVEPKNEFCSAKARSFDEKDDLHSWLDCPDMQGVSFGQTEEVATDALIDC